MNNLFSLEGKVALVTGGSRGIGEMIARAYVANGVKTYISSRSADVCESLAAELSKQGQCIAVPADLATMEGIESLANTLAEQEDHLDILVNNAGATWGMPLEKFPEKGWDKIMELNVKSPFFMIQKLLPLLSVKEGEDRSRIINISSMEGIGVPSFPTYSYSASKAAIAHLTKHLALHLSEKGINVNAIAPGPFPTKMTESILDNVDVDAIPCKRVGSAEDMGGTAIFLASKASEYITGTILPLEGGILVKPTV